MTFLLLTVRRPVGLARAGGYWKSFEGIQCQGVGYDRRCKVILGGKIPPTTPEARGKRRMAEGTDTPIAGADGCKHGWVFVYKIDGKLDAMVATTVREALDRLPRDTVLAIDIPIGLPKAGDRPCCRQARKLLQARRSSVFPVPVRACVAARTHDEAKEMHYRADGRKISAQAWAILPKIRDSTNC